MVAVDDAVIARLKSHGHTFEILVDCDLALALRHGEKVDLKDVVAAEKVFSDANKGLEVSEGALQEAFSTTEFENIVPTIVKKGEVQLTTEYREKLRVQKYKQILNMIHRNGVDPKTHLPHPPQRIENGLQEAKFHVDEYEATEKQVQRALKLLQPILPIKFEVKEIQVKIGPTYAAKAYPVLKQFGTILKEDWLNTGYYLGTIEMAGGLEEDFHAKLNDVCHGEVETEVVKTR